MFQSRTQTCNELRLENVGEQVRIVGWMENVREVGQNFAFVVVRDFYGTTQVVIETEDMMKVVKALNKASGHVRTEVSRRMHIRKAPRFVFVKDEGAAYAAHINQLLGELDIEPDSDAE